MKNINIDSIIIIFTSVMGSHFLWQTDQTLIRWSLFGAPFLVPSQFMGEQSYPIKFSSVTLSAAIVILVELKLRRVNLFIAYFKFFPISNGCNVISKPEHISKYPSTSYVWFP